MEVTENFELLGTGLRAQKKNRMYPPKLTLRCKQATGIEPASSAWEADILPMYYACKKNNCLFIIIGSCEKNKTKIENRHLPIIIRENYRFPSSSESMRRCSMIGRCCGHASSQAPHSRQLFALLESFKSWPYCHLALPAFSYIP